MLSSLNWTHQERVDLHLHSYYSDGLYSPATLIKMAANQGINILALTDHATMAGFHQAVLAGIEHDVYVLPGIELNGAKWDFIGLMLNESQESLLKFLERVNELRCQRLRQTIAIVTQRLINLTWEELVAFAAPALPSRLHLARLLVTRGFFASIDKAFQDFFNYGKPGYCPAIAPSDQECIEAITAAGGLAILVHPHWTVTKNRVNLIPELKRLHEWGVSGYEEIIPAFQDDEWQKIINQLGWIKVNGSNFHGPGLTSSQLGDNTIGADQLAILLERLPRSSQYVSWCKRLLWRAANLTQEELIRSLTPQEIYLDQLQRYDLLEFTPIFSAASDEYHGNPFILIGPGALEKENLIIENLQQSKIEILNSVIIHDYPKLAWSLYNLFDLPIERKRNELFKFSLDYYLFGEKANRAKIIFFRPICTHHFSLRQLKQNIRHALGDMNFYRVRYGDQVAINFTAYIHIPEEQDVIEENCKIFS